MFIFYVGIHGRVRKVFLTTLTLEITTLFVLSFTTLLLLSGLVLCSVHLFVKELFGLVSYDETIMGIILSIGGI
jgi:hypothetical protein